MLPAILLSSFTLWYQLSSLRSANSHLNATIIVLRNYILETLSAEKFLHFRLDLGLVVLGMVARRSIDQSVGGEEERKSGKKRQSHYKNIESRMIIIILISQLTLRP